MRNWGQKLHSLWGWSHVFLHEQRCMACQRPFTPQPSHFSHKTPQAFYCPQCLDKMPRKTFGFCPLCAESTAWPLLPPTLCGACLQKKPPWAHLWFYAGYENTLRNLLLRFKFYNDVRLSHALASLLLTNPLFTLARYDLIVPIPLHSARLKNRGYNQALELCKALLVLCNKSHSAKLTSKGLLRTHPSLPQAGLSRKKRKENTKNIFNAGQVAGKHILLVDDIITTGETALAATNTLLQNKAASVDIAVIAKTFARVR